MKIQTIYSALFCISYIVFALAQDFDPSKESSAPPILREPSQITIKNQNNRGQEWRALWVDGWNKGIRSTAEVQETVAIARQYGYNAIVVQARRRGDAIYLPTYPNTEPRVSGLPANFDALAEFIREANAYNIEVHAWITTLLISTSTLPTSPQHVVNCHPEYLMENSSGEKLISEGYYLDPGNPSALAWNEKVVMDLIQHYDIDGIHFDYIRYPQANSGYNPTAIARYNQEYSLTGKPNSGDARFSDWRRRQITDWLRTIYVKIMAVKPQIKVTAATFGGRSDAYHNRFQDWATWMYEGMLDANVPMNYSKDLAIFQTRCQDILANSYHRHVYMGVGAYLLNPTNTITQLQYARSQNSTGLILFSYANNQIESTWLGAYQQIYNNVFNVPVAVPTMAWKINPTTGYITGVVTSSLDNRPIYNAVISIPTLNKLIKSDGTGQFSLLGIPNNTYEIVCQANDFKIAKTQIAISSGKVSVVNFSLEPGITSSLIVDNQEAQFVGSWFTGVSAVDKYGNDYRYISKTTQQASATFPIPSNLDGRYRVYVWYSAGTNRSTTAQFIVTHRTGTQTITINQQQNSGKWNLLGTFDFSANSCHIQLLESNQDGKVVIADAIKLEKE